MFEDLIEGLLCAVGSFVLMAWCCVTYTDRVSAPRGWYVNGVHPDGRFEWRPVLGDPRELHPRPIHDDRHVTGRVYCTGGATPRQNGQKVWCQR